MKINAQVVKTISLRDLRLYFSNPTGYLFITLFIFLSALAAFWQAGFFADNLANLDKLNNVFPLLLIFFVSALTMNIWSEERRQGTDELLFTLPATDLEIVLGKYLAVLGIYSASLLLSLSHVLVLFWLGSPDIGLMFANYVGYWLAGAALLAVGMFASLLSINATFSFILGALFCAVFVYLPNMDWLGGDWLRMFLQRLSLPEYFADFAGGVISLSALTYFVLVAGILIYFNVILIGRRHWPAQADGYKMWMHYLVRAIAIVIAAFSIVFIFDRMAVRIDTTAERIHSLSRETKRLISSMPDDRKVLIQAYLSPETPPDYVEQRANIIGTLEEISAMSGGNIQVLIKDVTPYSEEAREARDKFNIRAQEVITNEYGRSDRGELYLGLAFTSGANEEVIPFFDKGLPVEYEIVRSIRSVTNSDRKKIGLVSTGLKLYGDFNFQTGQQVPPWRVVGELEKQFELNMVNADEPIEQVYDALIVPLPSSMTQPQMDNVSAYITAGHPTVLLVDPLPVVDITLSPILPSNMQMSPFMQNQEQPPPKGDLMGFLMNIGLTWDPSQIIWDSYNPHPDLAATQKEVVFIGSGNRNPEAFNQNDAATAGLQEVVLMFPGFIDYSPAASLTYTPLLETGMVSGKVPYQQMVRRSLFGLSVNPDPPHNPTPREYTMAARINGKFTIKPEDPNDQTPGPEHNINMLVISDIDFISSQFFTIRERGYGNYNFDNVTFFLNCIDEMAGDGSFIELRKRRIRHRTLTAVEANTEEFVQRRLEQEQMAKNHADSALTEARQRLTEKVNAVRQRDDLDEQTKQIMAQNLQEVENRRFETVQANIESQRDATIQKAHEDMEIAIRDIQTRIKMLAVLLPPIPVFVMGVYIFIRRRKREYEGALAARRLRS
ncbi:MAG: Gldg family protein [Candidatus Zixiibacteriota bacterium]